MRGVRAAVALVSLATLGCGAAPSLPRGALAGWHAVRHPSFRLVGDVPAARLRRLAEELALFDRVVVRLARMPPEPLEPVSVYLIADPTLARRFGLAGPVAGWMLSTLEGPFAAVEGSGSHVATRSVLLHEFTHALLRRNRRGPLAPWYDEGLASYFGTFSVRDGAAVVGVVPGDEIEWIARRGLLPLARVFEADARGSDEAQVRGFHATAWALSHQLLATPRGREELARFAARLERGEAWRSAQAAAFGRPVEQLQSELDAHVALLQRGVAAEAVIDPGGLVLTGPVETSSVGAAEIAYELGFLALQLGELVPQGSHAALARALFAAALALDASAPRAEAGLAVALALGGDAEPAQAHAERAVGRAPDDVRVRVQAGRVALARADAAGGREPDAESALRAADAHYRRALEIDPASAVAWEGLGATRRRLGRSDDALAALERARGLGWSPRIDLELGALHLASGRRDEAQALLRPLAADPHGGPASEQARAQLERAGLLLPEPSGAR